jgi:hypothetical protein
MIASFLIPSNPLFICHVLTRRYLISMLISTLNNQLKTSIMFHDASIIDSGFYVLGGIGTSIDKYEYKSGLRFLTSVSLFLIWRW